ncbi:hypothetical protein BSAE_1905 [Bifidobacterium pullorum subsp. saeculare DSM 6531 = LMG 14934]|uniref:Uncharacterized protein n=1 Tax=Bifidobacterium pullorum subsp. saeculare DSM 6531 = LMG 14934 TaxID=1437611 RepID=A0A087CPX7_9BIFI|nr:hypothetical protein BSAE_1905 [Bifidobacterium pullorum subsp. saeculare DSM 6531 = LMG 14934]
MHPSQGSQQLITIMHIWKLCLCSIIRFPV